MRTLTVAHNLYSLSTTTCKTKQINGRRVENIIIDKRDNTKYTPDFLQLRISAFNYKYVYILDESISTRYVIHASDILKNASSLMCGQKTYFIETTPFTVNIAKPKTIITIVGVKTSRLFHKKVFDYRRSYTIEIKNCNHHIHRSPNEYIEEKAKVPFPLTREVVLKYYSASKRKQTDSLPPPPPPPPPPIHSNYSSTTTLNDDSFPPPPTTTTYAFQQQ